MGIAAVRVLAWAGILGSSLLAGCGGGGGSSGGASTSSSSGTPGPSWTANIFAPSTNFQALCANPRSGTDPYTNTAYTDKQGTLLDELFWLRSWTHELYLWYDQVPDQNPSGFSTDASYFAVLKTSATTASGNPEDKFHFTYVTSTWEQLSSSGTEAGYGLTFALLATKPPRQAVVAYVEAGAAAGQAPISIARGAQILDIDGVDLVNGDTQADVNTLNAGLSPSTVGETHTFTILDAGATASRTVTLTAANITSNPTPVVTTIPTATGNVGYILFNDQLATAESGMINAITQLQTAGVSDLILDIRYNGGGYLDIASETAYMIAGPGPTTNQTFELQQFNKQYSTVNPVTGAAIAPVDFHTTTQGFSTTSGQTLPNLGLSRVFVLTGGGTCSASEAIMNSLMGVGVQVIQIGSTTCGKPYGFYPQDNCGTTYFSIEFRGVNAKGFGDYPDGFSPANSTVGTGLGVLVPGCSVADDFSHQLGDTAEGRTAAALAYRQSGVCSGPATGMANGLLHSDVTLVKSAFRQNRIYRIPGH